MEHRLRYPFACSSSWLSVYTRKRPVLWKISLYFTKFTIVLTLKTLLISFTILIWQLQIIDMRANNQFEELIYINLSWVNHQTYKWFIETIRQTQNEQDTRQKWAKWHRTNITQIQAIEILALMSIYSNELRRTKQRNITKCLVEIRGMEKRDTCKYIYKQGWGT